MIFLEYEFKKKMNSLFQPSRNILVNSKVLSQFFKNNLFLYQLASSERFNAVFEKAEELSFHKNLFREYNKTIPEINFVYDSPIRDFRRMVSKMRDLYLLEEEHENAIPKIKKLYEQDCEYKKNNILFETCHMFLGSREINVILNNKNIGKIIFNYETFNSDFFTFTLKGKYSPVLFSSYKLEKVEREMDNIIYELLNRQK